MTMSVQRRLRALVADHLGIDSADVLPDASFRDGLAVDSLDFVDLLLAVETDFDVAIPEVVVDGIQTFRDLVDATTACVQARHVAERRRGTVVQVAMRLASPRGGMLVRSGTFTAALAETITEDARWAGRGAQLELVLDPASDPAGLACVEERLGPLRRLGIDVSVVLEGLRLRGGEARPPEAGAVQPISSPNAA